MSVLKSKRKPSQFEVFHHLNKMRKEVTDLLLRDFGYDLDKAVKKVETDFYKSWFKNHYKIMSKKQRSNMDTLFNQLKEVTKCTLSPLPMAKS